VQHRHQVVPIFAELNTGKPPPNHPMPATVHSKNANVCRVSGFGLTTHFGIRFCG